MSFLTEAKSVMFACHAVFAKQILKKWQSSIACASELVTERSHDTIQV